MAEYTSNLNLEKPSGNENFRRQVINDNMDKVDKKFADYTLQVPYAGLTTGSVNTYAISAPAIAALTAGMAVAVKFNADSTGASTLNWNGKGAKGIKKSNGTDVTNLKTTGIYTLRYDGANFILQGEGASGNATAPDLLSGKTATTDAGEITGSMPDNGPAVVETINLTTEGAEYTIVAGFHSGLRKIKATITNIAAAVIKTGVTVGGIVGTFTADATAAAAQILSGYTAYVNGNKVTGTMTNKAGSATVLIPTTTDQAFPAGYYDGVASSGKVAGNGNLVAGNIKSGTAIFNVTGTFTADATAAAAQILSEYTAYVNGAKITGMMANRGGEEYAGWRRLQLGAIAAVSGRLHAAAPTGAYLSDTGGQGAGLMSFFIDDANYNPANWPTGVSIFGLAGTMPNRGTPTLQPGDAIPYGYYGGGSVGTGGRVRTVSGLAVSHTIGSFTVPSPGWLPRVCIIYLVFSGQPLPRTDGYLQAMLAVGIKVNTGWNSVYTMVAEDSKNGNYFDIPYQNGMAFNADGSVTVTLTNVAAAWVDAYYQIFE